MKFLRGLYFAAKVCVWAYYPVSAHVIDGSAIAARVTSAITERVASRIAAGHSRPGLAIVLVGVNPASHVYVRKKREMIVAVGMTSFAHDLPATISEDELLALVDALNADPAVHGILVQRPLPAHINAGRVSERIDWRKDVDGLHPENIGRLALREPRLRPCASYGCIRLLRETGEALADRHAVVVGNSDLVARPMALELLLTRCTVSMCDHDSRDLPNIVGHGDILVAAVNKPKFVEGFWIKPGAIVIDAGISRSKDGKLCGDVDFVLAKERAAWITPVPHGVGPMTVATLTGNTLLAAELQLMSKNEPVP